MWLEHAARRRRVLENWRAYVEAICREVRRYLEDARVLVFGSVARGDWSIDSDVDVLVISEAVPEDPLERARISVAVKEALDDPAAPIELHLATPRQYVEWYSRFIDVAVEVC